MKQTGSAYKSLKIHQNVSGSCMILLHNTNSLKFVEFAEKEKKMLFRHARRRRRLVKLNNICVIYVFNIFSQQNLASYYAI